MDSKDYFLIEENETIVFNNTEYENSIWRIDEYGNLHLTGDMVQCFLSLNEITEPKELEKIEDTSIHTRKTLFTRREIKYVPAIKWYTYKKRLYTKIITSCFTIIDKRRAKI